MEAQERLEEAGANAKRAEVQGDDGVAAAEWRRYRLIKDAMRNPDELLTEGIAISQIAIELAAQSR
jgi:negative regulator of sigma E activity